MLKAEQIKELAKRAGLSSEVLSKALSSEKEETLTFEHEGEFISNADLETVKTKAKSEGYNDGKTAGQEMLIKEIRTDEKLEFEGKSKENLIAALKAKHQKDFGVEPNKRITELEADKKALQDKLTESETKLKNEKESYDAKLNEMSIDQFIASKLPEKLANGLTREDAAILFKSKNKVEKTETGFVIVDPVTKQPKKDNKLNPILAENELKTFAESFGKIPEHGRGGKDDPGKQKTNIESFTKKSEVEEYFEKEKIPISDRAGILQKAMKNQGFEMDK